MKEEDKHITTASFLVISLIEFKTNTINDIELVLRYN